jgi:glycosyltransferase involved in cell wall biosynthesis
MYRETKIFCMPSRKEGFPLAGVEALREGCALMLTNFQSAFDLTNDGKFGPVVPINDTAALQAGLLSLCSNETRLKLICYSGQVYARENFNWDILVDKIYKKL